ncbi:hypothetical protein ACFV6B_39395 [Streptomyces microflavus]|uniref:hypothetical protein n=1 Tax=Streptomyces microflavus TaxID=1919 RepID=UPI00365BE8D4
MEEEMPLQRRVQVRLGFLHGQQRVLALRRIPVVQNVLRKAGLEATAVNALTVMDWALRLLGTGFYRLAILARSNPLAAAVSVSALLWWCHQKGYLTRDNWRYSLTQAGKATTPLLELANVGVTEDKTLSNSLMMV